MIEILNSLGSKKSGPKFELLSSANIALPAASRPITFYHGNYVYAYGDDSGTNFFKRFDVNNKAWSPVTINNNNYGGYGGVINNEFIMGFGKNGSLDRSFIRKFLLNTLSWFGGSLTNAPAPMSNCAYTVFRDRLYAIGSTAYPASVLHYTPATNSWANLSFVVSRQMGHAGSDGNHLYHFGGFSGAASSNQMHRADYETNTWVEMATAPKARHMGSQLCFNKGKLYCIGGAAANSGLNERSLLVYDITTNTWENSTAGMPGAVLYDENPGLVTDGTNMYYVSYRNNQVWRIVT